MGHSEETPNLSILPHVVGLCRSHHEDVEAHRAWIKLEDGEFRWYEPDYVNVDDSYESRFHGPTWLSRGPLNPQPGSREGKPKRKKFKGEKKRNRETLSIRCPKDAAEDGIEVLANLIEQAADKLGAPEKPPYYTLCAALYFFLTTEENPA